MSTDKSRRHGVARQAVLAGLSAALAFGGFAAPATMAFAATAGKTGKVTINQISANTGTTYDGYRLVKADVDESDKATLFEWENDATKTAVLNFLDQATTATGATKSYSQWLSDNHHTEAVGGVSAHDLPQNAMEYIAYEIGHSAEAAGTDTDPETKQQNSFTDNFAQALKRAGLAVTGVASNGEAFTAAQGYYLFVTTGTTTGDNEAGTAPIFVALGDTAKTVAEKAAIPTLDKKVKEDKSETFGKVADANKDQDLDFELTATLPTNYDAFDAYHVRFDDTLPGGMSLKDNNANSVVVKVFSGASDTTGVDVTSQLTGNVGGITYTGDVLTVNIADLRALTGVTITKDSLIKVDYKAHIDADGVIGQAGNDNSCTLTYTNDPVAKSDGVTSAKTTKTTTYQLGLEKVDKQTREALADAKFTIQVADSGESDAASVGKYVQADGSLGETAYEFVTSSDGTFTVPRIDEGTYTVRETAAPTGYEAIEDAVTVTIVATKDQSTGTVTALSLSVTGGNGPDGMSTPAEGATSVTATQDGVLESTVTTGAMRFRVSDDKETYLPGTGLTPSQAGTVAGIILVVVGVGAVVLRQRKAGEDGASE